MVKVKQVKKAQGQLATLQDQAVWLVMHPHRNMGWEEDTMWPWLPHEMIRTSQKIDYYLKDCKHKFIVCNKEKDPIANFSKWKQMNQRQALIKYCNKNNITKIVYTGFHYGVCILSEKEVGATAMYQNSQLELFVKRDLTDIGPGATVDSWGQADDNTKLVAQII
jgi:hypothetical protein